jgi:hypothetical protein
MYIHLPLLTYSAPATGSTDLKELPIELAEDSMKSPDGSWGCTVLSTLVIETVMV